MTEKGTPDDSDPIARRSFLLAAGTALATSLTSAGSAQAQHSAPAAAAPKPTVMILGSPHIGGSSGSHVFETRYDDMLAPERQRQIAECVNRLQTFRPTKVAVEIRPSRQAQVDAAYQAYRAGRFTLTASEEHQFGFRTATALGLARVFAIDVDDDSLYAGGLGEAIAFAKEHRLELYDRLVTSRQKEVDQEQAAIPTTTVLDLLRRCNDPAVLRRDHSGYLLLAQLVSGEKYIGIDWVQGWYSRNLRIYANLVRLIESADDRVLVVYGAGHVTLLAQFLRDSGLYEVESPLAYLA